MISEAHKKELEDTPTEVLVKRRTRVFERIRVIENLIPKLEKELADENDALTYIMGLLKERYEAGKTEAK